MNGVHIQKTNHNKHNQEMVTKINQNKTAIIKQTRKEQRRTRAKIAMSFRISKESFKFLDFTPASMLLKFWAKVAYFSRIISNISAVGNNAIYHTSFFQQMHWIGSFWMI